ncbi:ABC transporter permease [Sedimentibacter sp. zth1]|uniref:ABC transporter permease n=1 Tax=Sedimentibacter sp. zth1 TaxID=2816908 RepID=UPI001A92B2C9|nr:ABC transporter permease [Sedimentibacter sp. zth1]QSX06955.1 ABC transporter permease [Sedimentibacter sp. zth1]
MKKKGIITSFLVRLKFSAQMAANGITSNLLRTFLTVLGIAIGVAAVVSLMGIGEGARQAVVAQFESLGQNVILVKSNFDEYNFEMEDARDLQDRVDNIQLTTPVVYTKADIRWRRDDSELEILGVNNNYPAIRDHQVASGNFFTSLHAKQRAPVVVLGYNVGVSLLNGRSPVGQTMKINGMNYRIIGVLSPKGEGNGDGIDDKIIIPYTSALRITEEKNIKEIWAKCDTTIDVDLSMVQLGRIFNNKIKGTVITPPGSEEQPNPGEGGDKGIIDGGMNQDSEIEEPTEEPIEETNVFKKGEEPITITSLNQLVQQADQANRIMTVLLGGIAAVSLLVGGIGIMNIMLVAVTERTSEIGVRRALGAKQEDLLIQFLLEAIYVSIIGCIVGIALGAWAIRIVSSYGLEAALNAKSIKIAIGVALSSGLLFGVYPAINASSLPPVEALKR